MGDLASAQAEVTRLSGLLTAAETRIAALEAGTDEVQLTPIQTDCEDCFRCGGNGRNGCGYRRRRGRGCDGEPGNYSDRCGQLDCRCIRGQGRGHDGNGRGRQGACCLQRSDDGSGQYCCRDCRASEGQ